MDVSHHCGFQGKSRCILVAIWLLHATSLPALAHEGPPYPIVVDRTAGPFVMSVWGDPDVGIGTFYMILEPLNGSVLPGDVKVHVAVQPLSGRLPEARYSAERDRSSKSVQFKAEIPFDAQEQWRLRVMLESSQGNGEVTSAIEVTPPGFGRWDLLIYAFPFLLIGFLWLRAFFRKSA
ncbi:MAG TPA: hypothetical protein VFR18_22245 [Terriglobia bacterium]|nr:hypothetical protein [Terriglobia bacterium]